MGQNISDCRIAFVDGSYWNNIYSWGVIILGQPPIELSGASDDEYIQYRQVSGELKAAETAIQWGLDNNVKTLLVAYDAKGIAAWPLGKWRAKNKRTQNYRDFVRQASKNMRIGFVYTKAHSDIYWNERADQLARQARLQFSSNNY